MNELDALVPKNGTMDPAAIPPDSSRGVNVKPRADSRYEYVSARPEPRIARYLEALPQYIDDVTRDFGHDLYERMLLDPQVFANIEVLKLTVLAKKLNITPRIKDEKDPRYARAKEYADFCERNINRLDMPFKMFLYQMLDSLAFGNKVAEKVVEYPERGIDAGRMMLSRLKVKPRRVYSFVVDAFNNVLGLLGIIPGRSYILYQGSTLFDPERLSNLLPRDKFCILTNNPKDGDPRGRSTLRSVYDPWWQKTQLKGEALKALTQFGSPILVGTTAEHATAEPETDPEGNATGNPNFVLPEQAMLNALKDLRNGAIAAIPYGADIKTLHVAGAAESFLRMFDYYDKQITKGVLAQTLATEEGEHQARAAAETHQDVLDMVMDHIRTSVHMMIEKDIFKFLLLVNFGEDVADEYCPIATLGSEESQNWHEDVASVTALCSSGFMAPSQARWAEERLGMPARTDRSKWEWETILAGTAQNQQQNEQNVQGDPAQGGQPGVKGAPPGFAQPAHPGTEAPWWSKLEQGAAQFSRNRRPLTREDIERARVYLNSLRAA